MNTTNLVWLQSHDEVNQYLAPGLAVDHDLIVQPRWLEEGLPDGDCRGLVVDLDSVASRRPDLQRLVDELTERSHPYPVVVFGYSLEDDQIMDLRAVGIHVFQHGVCPAVFAAIARQSSDEPFSSPSQQPAHPGGMQPMSPVKLQMSLQPAPAGLVRTAVRGQCRTVYVPAPYADEPVSGPGECVWTDGVMSVFVKAHRAEDGLVVDLHVTVEPPAPLGGAAALAA
jgi:hypothetical protein